MSDLALFRGALKDLLSPKKAIASLILILLPALLSLFWRASAGTEFQSEIVYNTLAAGLLFGFILVILSAVFGTGVLSQEMEQKTIVYLLTHPVPRWRILFMKFLAAFFVIAITVSLSTIALAFATYGSKGLSDSPLARDLLVLHIGALGYGSLFLLLSTIIHRPLLYGLLFAFGWESWVPTMPGNFQKISLMSYLRVLAPHPQPEAESVEISQLLTVLNPTTIPESTAIGVVLGVIVMALTTAFILFSVKEYVPRDDME
jgi:ABC-2 type transport system permease protein